jgi:hypothetical protein
MSQSNHDAQKAPHSLTPISLQSNTDDDDLAQMHKGRGARGLLLMAAVVAAIVGGAKLLRMMDAQQAYSVAANQLERTDTDDLDAFLRCAIPTYQRSVLAAPDGLSNELERVTQRSARGYARTLTGCMPLLATVNASLAATKPPADVKQHVDAVIQAGTAFGKAWLELRELLQRSGAVYDSAETATAIGKINTAWQQYLTTRESAKKALSARM